MSCNPIGKDSGQAFVITLSRTCVCLSVSHLSVPLYHIIASPVINDSSETLKDDRLSPPHQRLPVCYLLHMDSTTVCVRKRDNRETGVAFGDLLEPFLTRPAWLHHTFQMSITERGYQYGGLTLRGFMSLQYWEDASTRAIKRLDLNLLLYTSHTTITSLSRL